MSEDMSVVEKNELVALTAEIVSAFVANNENGGGKVDHGSGGMILLRAA